MVCDLIGARALPAVLRWFADHRDVLLSDNHSVRITVDASGRMFADDAPTKSEPLDMVSGASITNPSTVCLSHLDQEDNARFTMIFPINWLLLRRPPKYYLYQVHFGSWLLHNNNRVDPSFDAFARGYIGITSRDPLVRLREHMRNVAAGRGYYFHNSWRGLLGCFPSARPTFSLLDFDHTLDGVYEQEERLVAAHSLAPTGLNAIPGGRAGLAMLHLLRKDGRLPSLVDRDAALRDLECGRSPIAAHFRKGHIRNLPAGCAKRTTWVSSSWVNMPTEVAA